MKPLNSFQWSRKKIFLVLLGFFLVGSGIYAYFSKTPAQSTQRKITATVGSGQLENSIKTTGTANLVNEQKIRFNQQGKITTLNFKEGQAVKKGQIIAGIDASTVQNNIKQVEISLNNSRLSLAEELRPVEEKDILQAENSLIKGQQDLLFSEIQLENGRLEKANSQSALEESILTKERSLATAQKERDIQKEKNEITLAAKAQDLELAQSQLATLILQEGRNTANTDVDIQKSLESGLADGKKYVSNIESDLLSIDEIFGISDTNRSKNDAYETFLSAKDTTLKERVKSDWYTSRALLTQVQLELEKVTQENITTETLTILLGQIAKLSASTTPLALNASNAVKASVETANYSQSSINSDYAKMQSTLTSSQTTESQIIAKLAELKKLSDPDLIKTQSSQTITKQKLAVENLENDFTLLKKELGASLNKLQATVDNLEGERENLRRNLEFTKKKNNLEIAQLETSLKNATNTLELNRANLEYIRKGPTQEKITRLKNDIAKQVLSLADAKKNLDKYQIEAPFDGVIRSIDFKIGDNITAEDTKYVYIDNPNLLEISATLDQIEVAKIQLGQEVKIVFDAFAEKTFTGSVTQINSTPISTSGVTSYTIKIAMDKGKQKIFSGMTAKLTIVIERKENILVIPSEFIQKKGKKTFVLLDDGSPTGKSTEVIIGMATTLKSEVLGGIEAGQKILRFVQITSSTSSQANSSNLRGITGGTSSRSSRTQDGGMPPPGP